MTGNARPFTIGEADITVALAYTGAASTAHEIVGGGTAVRIVNAGTGYVFIDIGGSAVADPVVPVDGTPTVGFVVAPGATEVLTLRADCWIKAIGIAAATGTLYLFRGEGL